MTIDEIEKIADTELPTSYKTLLSEIDDFEDIYFNDCEELFPDSKGTPWFFWGLKRLTEECEIKESGKAFAFQHGRTADDL